MQIKIDNQVIFEITQTDFNILANNINEDILQQDIARRLEWIISQKKKDCLTQLKLEWVSGGKLAANGVTNIPLDDNELAELIFSQPNYKSAKQRDSEAQI